MIAGTTMVLLRHDTGDGGWHHDWMIAGRSCEGMGDAHTLLTFRVRTDAEGLGAGGFAAEQIAHHRAIYLEYEGEVGGGRGVVSQLARGRGSAMHRSDETLLIEGCFDGGRAFRLLGRPDRVHGSGVAWWWFERVDEGSHI